MPLLFPLILMLITKISADQHYKRSTINKISLARGGKMTSIGGGAINEKNRTRVKGKRCSGEDKVENSNGNGSDSGDGFDPSNKLSHLLHSAVGIDRYPRYLHRWNGPDLDRLESALEGTLQLVRTQRKEMKKRNRDIEILLESSRQSVSPDLEIDWSILDPPDNWADIRKILDPRAADAIFLSSSFRCKESSPSLDEILSGNIAVQLDFSQLDGWLEEEAEGVYSFPLLSESFCMRLRTLLKHIMIISETPEYVHLNLGRRPIDMDAINFAWLNDFLLHLIVRPLSCLIFRTSELDGGDLDFRHGFVTGYSPRPSASSGTHRQWLNSHTDDSEITLNLCLGGTFKGGDLTLSGLRGVDEEDWDNVVYSPSEGTAVLHVGRMLHRVSTVTSGERYAYVLWARSWGDVRNKSCPCCWLNRRGYHHGHRGVDCCICGPRWN